MIPYLIAVLAVLTMIILTAYHASYRRQVEELSRQIEFINNNKTEMHMITDISSKELVRLTEEINKLNIRFKETEKEYKSQD